MYLASHFLKGISGGAERCKFQIYSAGVLGQKDLHRNQGLQFMFCYNLNSDSGKRIPSETAAQEEQNGMNFSFVAPSSEEL